MNEKDKEHVLSVWTTVLNFFMTNALLNAFSSFGTHSRGMILGFPMELTKDQMSSRDGQRGKKTFKGHLF